MIELFFDFISPYAYLACSCARELGQRVGREVEPRAVLLAAVLNERGTKGPAEVPARRAYVIRDVLRAADRAGVEIGVPPTHPFNPLVALRTAVLDLDRATRWRIVDALYAAVWRKGESIESADRVAAVLREAGLDGAKLVELAATAEAKERLRRNTDEAIERGAFGVPTMFVDGEMFFGFDSFPAIERFVRGEDPVAKHAELLDRWARLPASATRTPR